MASPDMCPESETKEIDSSSIPHASSKSDTVQYKAKNYHQHFTSRLVSYREREKFTDVVLKCSHLELPCHKVVLAAASSYFHAMFGGGLKEAKSDVVELKTFKPDILSTIIDFIYTAEATISSDNVQRICSACDELELEELKEGCDMYMADRVEPANCLGLFVFSKALDLKLTLQESTTCMLQRLDHVLRDASDEEFKALDEANVIEYISNDDLEVDDEVSVFRFVEKWVNIDHPAREKSIEQLMGHVRLAFSSPLHLCGVIEESPIMQSRKCLLFLHEAKTYQLVPTKRQSIMSERTRPRKCFDELVMLDGNNNQGKCWCLGKKEQAWKVFTALPAPVFQYSKSCMSGYDIIMTGGYVQHRKYTNASWSFSLNEKKWQALPSMIDSRGYHALVSVGGEVYALGGCYRKGILSKVEKLDTRRQKWTQLAPMKCELQCHLAVHIDEHLFVMAGERSGQASQMTQAFNLRTGQWATRADMPMPCGRGSAVSLRGRIFVVGGTERYCMSFDPRQDVWTIHTQPDQQRIAPAAAVWKGKVFLSGGQNRNDAEEYDKNQDKWTKSSETLPTRVGFHTLLIVNTHAGLT